MGNVEASVEHDMWGRKRTLVVCFIDKPIYVTVRMWGL